MEADRSPKEIGEDVLATGPQEQVGPQQPQEAEAGEQCGGQAKRKHKKSGRRKKKPTADAADAAGVGDGVFGAEGVVRIELSERKGRCTVANRDIAAGTTLFSEEPMVMLVTKADNRVCKHCAGDCVLPGEFCRAECRVQAEELQKKEAFLTRVISESARMHDTDENLLKLVTRLLLFRAEPKLQPSSPNHIVSSWELFMSLQHHIEHCQSDWKEATSKALEDVLSAMPEAWRVSVDEATKIAARLNSNLHGIQDFSGTIGTVGVGMFPTCALLNHSCWPNCKYVYTNGAMHMRTIRDVKAGEELVTHYIDLLQSRKARLKELEELRFFACLCTRCEEQRAESLWRDPLMAPLDVRVDAQLNAVHCENCGANGGFLPSPKSPNEYQCFNCRDVLPAEEVEAMLQLAKALYEFAKNEMMELQKTAVETFLQSYDPEFQSMVTGGPASGAGAAAGATQTTLRARLRQSRQRQLKLHSMHAWVLESLVTYSNHLLLLNQFALSAKCLTRKVQAMKAVFPAFHPELGLMVDQLADCLHQHARNSRLPPKTHKGVLRDAKQYYSEAKAIREISLGASHPLTQASASKTAAL